MKRLPGFLLTAVASFGLGWIAHERLVQVDMPPTVATSHKTTPRTSPAPPKTQPLPAEIESGLSLSQNSQKFRQLLASQDFDEAMLLFEQVEAADDRQLQSLRATLLAYLQASLEQGQAAKLVALIDAYLSRYYGDIDVLMILAEHQRQQGYPEEAARTFQYAFTYAYQPAQREKVRALFQALVAKTDTAFSQQQQWVELLGFYQLLESIDLSQPGYRLQQAAAYLELGDVASARDLLTPLMADVQWSGKASDLLVMADALSGEAAGQSTASDSIPLQRRGSHYLVKVRLNDAPAVTLMIDTGASITSLSQSSFETLSQYSAFHYLGTRLFNTANGITQGAIYQADQLSLGSHVLRDVKLAVLDFQQDQAIDGLLGMNVLQHFRFEIDQDQQVIHLQPRK